MDFFAIFVRTGKGFFIRESLRLDANKVEIDELPELRAWCLERFGHDSQPVRAVDRVFRKLAGQIKDRDVGILIELFLDLTVRQKWPVRGQEFWHPLAPFVWKRILEIGLEPHEWIDLYNRMLFARSKYRERKPRGTYDYTAFKRVIGELLKVLTVGEQCAWRKSSPKRLRKHFS